MIEPDGWPDIDEDNLYGRSGALMEPLRQLDAALKSWQSKSNELFGDPGLWRGSASVAAGGAMGTNISSMLTLQQHLVRAITWYNHAAGVVAEKKQQIALYVKEAQDAILQLRGATGVDPEERDAAIERLIATVNAVNRSIVATAAAWIKPFADWQAPADALEQLLASAPAPQTGGSPPANSRRAERPCKAASLVIPRMHLLQSSPPLRHLVARRSAYRRAAHRANLRSRCRVRQR